MLDYLPFLVVLLLWVWAFIDCLTTPEQEVRHLPKVVWILLILFFGEVLLGPLAWLLAGRRRGAPVLGRGAGFAPDGPAPLGRPLAPDDDPEFLASLQRDNERRRREGRGDATT
ncbi:PLD nuclease N-terminal domain-containing protein [Kitasatospora sp. NBC_01250]|uniref:PLD nuclease N-terminal domain-containing protein n=1 Tax=unclassified Kitasatospora TaxID=2633591 RepID=UPI002E14BA2F|nr:MULTISPECIES: PLD nuclease N-terminal domain-containing protein [unclassified Kitasatospora]WSJ67805.1 PLD nuclease N-terminal domain-containing protein [Kitasatospora sp. NBC_01302]